MATIDERKAQRARTAALRRLAELHRAEFKALQDEERAALGLPPVRPAGLEPADLPRELLARYGQT